MNADLIARFGEAYAHQRAAEGRAYLIDDLLSLPHLKHGPLKAQWAVRARTFEAFERRVLRPLVLARGRPLDLLDLGAGNGWLSYRIAMAGHRTTALDIRADAIDGLGAATPYVARCEGRMAVLSAPFEAIPLAGASMDICLFNAALHYATDLAEVLAEAARVARPDGIIAILDSPFYQTEEAGLAMVAEKMEMAGARFGELAGVLTSIAFVEFLTVERLKAASADLSLEWRRERVRYPLGYELRPLRARLRGERPPSRFDLWIGQRR